LLCFVILSAPLAGRADLFSFLPVAALRLPLATFCRALAALGSPF